MPNLERWMITEAIRPKSRRAALILLQEALEGLGLSLRDTSPKLRKQYLDFALKGGKSPLTAKERTRAMTELYNRGATLEGKSAREFPFIPDSADPMWKDKKLKRVYALGSIASDKARPADVDLLISAKGDPKKFKEGIARFTDDPYSYDLIDPDLLTYEVRSPWQRRAEVGARFAAHSAKKYGKKYSWVRLLGATGAVGAGLALPKEAEANPLKSLAQKTAKAAAKRVRQGKDVYRAVKRSSAFREMNPRAYTSYEPIGRYWGINVDDLPSLIRGGPVPGGIKGETGPSYSQFRNRYLSHGWSKRQAKSDLIKVVKARLNNPKLRIKAFSEEEWDAFLEKVPKPKLRDLDEKLYKLSPETARNQAQAQKITDSLLAKGWDGIILPDSAAGQPDLMQFVQLTPGIMKARLGGKTKIIGAAGAATGVGLALPDKAEAGPGTTATRKLVKKLIRNRLKELTKEWRKLPKGKRGMSPKQPSPYLENQIVDFIEGTKRLPVAEGRARLAPMAIGEEREWLAGQLQGSGLLDMPELQRAYIYGSFGTKKGMKKGSLVDPNDLDLIVKVRSDTKMGSKSDKLLDEWSLETVLKDEPHRDTQHLTAIDLIAGKHFGRLTESEIGQLVNKAIAGTSKYGRGHKWTRIAGAVGATGVGALTLPDEAEAMPNLVKPAGQVIKGAITSSTKRLKGSKIFGRIVKEVRMGNKGWRSVIFETGEQRAFTVQEINDLNRKVGDDFYRSKFKDAGAAARRQQALTSLQYHFDRSPMKPGHSNVLGTMDLTERQLMLHKGRLKELAPELDRGTLKFVKTTEFGAQEVGGHFSAPMPAEYADELEKLDFVEIIDYRTKRINK